MSTEEPRGDFTTTFKHGKGYEETWTVIRSGTAKEHRQKLRDYAGLHDAIYEAMMLPELEATITLRVQALSATMRATGGRVVESIATPAAPAAPALPETPANADAPATAVPPQDDPPFEPDPPKATAPTEPVFAAIDAAKSKDDLKEVWMTYKAEFSRKEVNAYLQQATAKFS